MLFVLFSNEQSFISLESVWPQNISYVTLNKFRHSELKFYHEPRREQSKHVEGDFSEIMNQKQLFAYI